MARVTTHDSCLYPFQPYYLAILDIFKIFILSLYQYYGVPSLLPVSWNSSVG